MAFCLINAGEGKKQVVPAVLRRRLEACRLQMRICTHTPDSSVCAHSRWRLQREIKGARRISVGFVYRTSEGVRVRVCVLSSSHWPPSIHNINFLLTTRFEM